MEADAGIHIAELRVDGGATANNLLMQIQADILNARVVRPAVTEVTAIGAAYLAGLAINYWSSVDAIQQQWQISQSFVPDPEINTKAGKKGWYRAVRAAQAWTETDSE